MEMAKRRKVGFTWPTPGLPPSFFEKFTALSMLLQDSSHPGCTNSGDWVTEGLHYISCCQLECMQMGGTSVGKTFNIPQKPILCCAM